MSERARIEYAQGTRRHLQPDNFLEAVGTRHIGTDAPGDSIPPCWRRESVENRNAAKVDQHRRDSRRLCYQVI